MFVVSASRRKREVRWALPLLFVYAAAPVQADDRDLFVRSDDLRTVLFGSLEAGRSSFGTLGIKRTLGGPLDRSGPVSMSTIGYGRTHERVEAAIDASQVLRYATEVSSLVGYQWATSGFVATALAGPEVANEQLTFDGVLTRLSRPRLGARVYGEIWSHPTNQSLLTATIVAGTARRGHLWARSSAGYRLWSDVFAGPEASLYLTEEYQEWRAGAHLTGLALGHLKLRISAGWQGERDTSRQGPYWSVSAYIRM